jgi:metal-dependent hydrolase (beta-lactamase superfamily II)
MVTNFLGQILKRDVGKRVYMCAGGQHISVENDEQYQRRLAKLKQ